MLMIGDGKIITFNCYLIQEKKEGLLLLLPINQFPSKSARVKITSGENLPSDNVESRRCFAFLAHSIAVLVEAFAVTRTKCRCEGKTRQSLGVKVESRNVLYFYTILRAASRSITTSFIPFQMTVVCPTFAATTITTIPQTCVDVFTEISIRLRLCWRKCEDERTLAVNSIAREEKTRREKINCGSFFFHCTGVFL
jgi:hypothetical protein